MKTARIWMTIAWMLLPCGCAAVQVTRYDIEMTKHTDGVIFVGFTCNAPSGWSGDRSSKDTIVGIAREVIDAELKRSGFEHMSINVDDPVRYEGSTGRLQLFASAGDMTAEQLLAKTKQIIAADPLGKRHPKPFYGAKGQLSR